MFDRYDVRLKEMRQSNRIIEQAIDRLPEGPINADAPEFVPPPKEDVQHDMAALIRHFKLMEEAFARLWARLTAPSKGQRASWASIS